MKKKITALFIAAAIMCTMSVGAYASSCTRGFCVGNTKSGCTSYFSSSKAGKYYSNSVREFLSKFDLSQFNWSQAPKEESKDTSEDTNTVEDNSATEPDKSNDAEQTAPDSSFEAEVVRLVNEARAQAGLSAVTVNTNVQKAAYARAQEIKKTFSHTRPDGTRCFTILAEYGVKYSGAGENIAMGQSTPEEVMNAWMNSSGHRANILKASFTQIGVGYYTSGGQTYWTQLFIN